MTDPPIACSLDAAGLAARRAGLLADLLRHAHACEALVDGMRFTFEPSSATLDLIARTIDAERQCCRFLRFHLTIEPDLRRFLLDLTGPAGTAAFLQALLDSA